MANTDFHKHTCERCGNTWVHDTFVLRNICQLVSTHKCSNCGKMVSAKSYDSDTDSRPSVSTRSIEIRAFYGSLTWGGCLDGYYSEVVEKLRDYAELQKELAIVLRKEAEARKKERENV